jgi:hypothetical protein
MDIKSSMKGQYHAGIAMLRQCVERCPEDLWTAGRNPRFFWHIAYHGIFYTHLYLVQRESDFVPWTKHREESTNLWEEAPVATPYSKDEILDYIDQVDGIVDSVVDGLDLSTEESGFHWYKSINKLDHELMNIRHLQGHVGQLSEILFNQGYDTDWVAIRPRRT